MQSSEISKEAGASPAETAKVLQLLVLGGFVNSRRGPKGGFQLASTPDQLTTGEIINFFLSRRPIEDEGDCPVMWVFRETMEPAQDAFASLTLADVVAGRFKRLSEQPCGQGDVR